MINTSGRGTASASFSAIGTIATVVCTDARALPRAVDLTRTRLDELDRVASRFREDSELATINARSTELAGTDRSAQLLIPVSTTLGLCLRAAIRAERLTAALVRPSLGAALMACGYDDDLEIVRARGGATASDPFPVHTLPQAVLFDESQWCVRILAGTLMDLGASAKAWAADSIAAELATVGAGGYLVDLGGDIAVSGPPPPGGWAIGVRDWNSVVAQTVCSFGQAFATSSTRLRIWVQQGSPRHHIIDPRTGLPARSRWAQVTCAGADAVQANAASTAAIILDDRAPRWLSERHIPARLVTDDCAVVTTSGWPGSDDSSGA
ncbi:FAD:protein FMN transferase [Nocardia niigatensis]